MKKKILAIVLCVAMLAIAIVGGTMAYFTDTHQQTNTFTYGSVDIRLTEAVVEKVTDKNSANYGDLVAQPGVRTDVGQNYGTMYPGQTIAKDPTIENLGGSEDAYIAAKITVTSRGDIHSYLKNNGEWGYILGVEQGYDNLDITKLVHGGLVDEPSTRNDDWNKLSVYETATCVIYQVPDRDSHTYTFYIFIKEAVAANGNVVLFDRLEIPEGWDNEEIKQFERFSIKIQAYATQEYGFKDCFTAMTTAFPDDFDF